MPAADIAFVTAQGAKARPTNLTPADMPKGIAAATRAGQDPEIAADVDERLPLE